MVFAEDHDMSRHSPQSSPSASPRIYFCYGDRAAIGRSPDDGVNRKPHRDLERGDLLANPLRSRRVCDIHEIGRRRFMSEESPWRRSWLHDRAGMSSTCGVILAGLGNVLGDSRLGHGMAKLEQLLMESRRVPRDSRGSSGGSGCVPQ